MQQAFLDSKRQFQDGLSDGPSAFLKAVSNTADDMKQKVTHPSLLNEWPSFSGAYMQRKGSLGQYPGLPL